MARMRPCSQARPVSCIDPFVPSNVDVIIDHGGDLSTRAKKQKTYRRLFGMIFFGGFGATLVAAMQRLATTKSSKNTKNRKANSKYFPPNPRFSAKSIGFLETKFVSGCCCVC
jgi:hypothetical protein